MQLLYESFVRQWEYTAQPNGFFGCRVNDAKSAALLLTFTSQFVFRVLYLSFSLSHLVELKLLERFKNEATCAQVWVIHHSLTEFQG